MEQKHFKDENKGVVGEGWSWRPSTTVTDVNTDKAEQMLKEDRRLLIRELFCSLNVSLERVYHIVTVDLGMSWVCVRSAPHISDEQKGKHLEVCQENVILDEQNHDFFLAIITCDES
jgi:hypothetical protein